MHPVDGAIERIHELETGTGEAMDDYAAVRAGTIAEQKAAFFEAVHEAGDIGVAGYETAGNLFGTDAAGGAAEDAEDVVLSGRERVRLQQAADLLHEQAGGANDGEDGLLFEQANGFGRPDFVLRL
jgi:hypothetical protein